MHRCTLINIRHDKSKQKYLLLTSSISGHIHKLLNDKNINIWTCLHNIAWVKKFFLKGRWSTNAMPLLLLLSSHQVNIKLKKVIFDIFWRLELFFMLGYKRSVTSRMSWCPTAKTIIFKRMESFIYITNRKNNTMINISNFSILF